MAQAIAITAAMITSSMAADLPADGLPDLSWRPLLSPAPYAQWETEFGARYWFSSGRTQVDLFGATQSVGQLSRLSYSNLQAHSGEIFGRVEHQSGFFIKGFAGGGVITGGNLRDEDFTPFTVPYSSTNSEQRDGRLAYGTVDLGWTWRSEGTKLGFFLGYFYSMERINAFGCTQTAANLACIPAIPTSVLGITQETSWHAARVGFNSEWRFGGGWRANAEIAWIPYAVLNASDTHWQRIPTDFSGPTPELGGGAFNVQLEAVLSYQFLNGISVGLGGRYWRIDTTGAQAHFESSAVGGGVPQVLSVVTERWGGFLQASYKFGVLRPTRYN
jgi:hypothetical protein